MQDLASSYCSFGSAVLARFVYGSMLNDSGNCTCVSILAADLSLVPFLNSKRYIVWSVMLLLFRRHAIVVFVLRRYFLLLSGWGSSLVLGGSYLELDRQYVW